MDQIEKPREPSKPTVMKAASDKNHVEEAEDKHPDIKKSDTRVGLTVNIHSDNIKQEKVAKSKHTGIKEPYRKSDLLVNSQSVEKVEICKSNREDTNKNNDDMYKGGMVEDMQPDDKRSGTKSELLVENHSVVIGIKEEVEDKHSGTNEPDRKANMVEGTDTNIDVMNHGDEVEGMQPDIKESDTESDLLVKAHPNVIGKRKRLRPSIQEQMSLIGNPTFWKTPA